MRFEESLKLHERALRVTPEGTQTISKGNWPIPLFLNDAIGSIVFDEDNNRFVDYSMGLGSVILGYRDYYVESSVLKQSACRPNGFSAPTRLEIELAEKICEIYPGAEMVRFFKNGSDATEAAIRLARAYTGLREIIFNAYHGFHDWCIWNRDALGVKEDEDCRPNGYYPSSSTAGMILDPTSFHNLDLIQNQKNCEANGAVLILDEVISGFRLALGGAAEKYGVTPDLVCLGKAMGNGYAISAVAGKREIMSLAKDCFLSSTHGGDTIGLAASLATIKQLENKDYSFLYDYGKRLMKETDWLKWNRNAPSSRPIIWGPSQAWILECMKRGILSSGFHNISFAHTEEDLEKTVKVYGEVQECLSTSLPR